jgi:hypothetical protein
MTSKETCLLPTSAGEARSRGRRRIFYAIFLFSLFLGLVGGVSMGLTEDGDLKFSSTTAWSLAAFGALLIGGFSIWFYKWADEVEVKDNLWANTVALHVAFAVGVPWAFLAEMGYAPGVSPVILFLIMAGSAALYYTAVKLWRML